MSIVEVKVPNIGVEGEVEVVELCVAVGQSLSKDDVTIVVESDKATVEVPSPVDGVVETVSVAQGDKVSEGVLILTVKADEAAASDADVSSEEAQSAENSTTDAEQDSNEQSPLESVDSSGSVESIEDVVVPDLGGSADVEVIEVVFAAGDTVEPDQTLIVLESDKATMEIPSPVSGMVESCDIVVGSKVSEGDLIGRVKVASSPTSKAGIKEPEPTQAQSKDSSPNTLESVKKVASSPADKSTLSAIQDRSSKVHAGPAVRKFAREHGVLLDRVKGTGPKGRILKEDLRDYIKSQVQAAQKGQGGAGLPTVSLPDFTEFGDVTNRAMDRIQKVTAENMQRSWLNVPHVTQFDEADITELENFRADNKTEMELKGIKITPVAFILKACAYVLEKLPQFNVSIDMQSERVYEKNYIHIGLAVDTPAGLVVPVIRDVNKKGLWEIAQECRDLASKAKDRKLKPADMQGGCFTVSSLGGLGGTAFTPIVNTPEVAILGVSKSQIKPVWDGESSFVPRLMLPLSLSYDHRAINGADAARFTSMLSAVLGDIRKLLL